MRRTTLEIKPDYDNSQDSEFSDEYINKRVKTSNYKILNRNALNDNNEDNIFQPIRKSSQKQFFDTQYDDLTYDNTRPPNNYENDIKESGPSENESKINESEINESKINESEFKEEFKKKENKLIYDITKALSVKYAILSLTLKGYTNWIDMIKEHGKQDDLTDALLLCLNSNKSKNQKAKSNV